MTTFVIEHMEEDDVETKVIPEWVELEYRQMRLLAGPDSVVHFTHLSHASRASLASAFGPTANTHERLARGDAHTIGVLELMKSLSITLDKVCLLDPKAERALSPEDGETFAWFLFGGILGDDPPRDRTSELRALGFPTRHLGPVQMTTDTALGVTNFVVKEKTSLEKITYLDFPTIKFNAHESVEMPFRYIANSKGDPTLPPGMRELLHKDLNKSFDF